LEFTTISYALKITRFNIRLYRGAKRRVNYNRGYYSKILELEVE
jgi:hypothetical protein